MAFVTSLSLLMSTSVNRYVQDWNASAQAIFTLDVPTQSVTKLNDIIKELKQVPEIESVMVLDKTYVQKLLTQLGIAPNDPPILIDFVVSKTHLAHFNVDAIFSTIQKLAPNSTIIKPVLASPEALSMAKTVELASFGFGLLMLLAMCGTIIFLMVSEMQTHTYTITLLNLLGAPNYFISKIFQRYASIIMLKSFFISLGLNICLYYASYSVRMETSLYLTHELSLVVWLYIVFGVPLLMVAIIQFIVPITVLSRLKQMYNTAVNP
jgi:cell division protein FtsX